MSPSRLLPEVDHFVPAAPSKEAIDFIPLQTLDLSSYNDGPAAQATLASIVHEAMTTAGFFTLINHGIPESTITRHVDIGHTILRRTPLEEKIALKSQIHETGSYPGFKLRGVWSVGGDARDRIEQFNCYRDLSQNTQPAALAPFKEEVQALMDFVHKDVLGKLLTLFGMALGLEDDQLLVKAHSYEGHDESWLRYMEYEAFHDERDKDGKTMWLGGHKDFTTLSLLFSQPMSTLQVREEDGGVEGWRYVAHVPGAIIVNAGEIMEWLTGGYFKAAIHRVVEPPRDQMGRDRSSVFYFTVPNDGYVINTLLEESPVLRGAGVKMAHRPEDAPTSKEWCRGRIQVTGKSKQAHQEGEDGAVVTERVGKVTTSWYK